MSKVERIGVSLESGLLGDFDRLIKQKGYDSRSEAIRDMIRQELSRKKLSDSKTKAVAAVFIVYDHHAAALAQKLLELQHSHLLKTISSMHIHITHQDCLEIVVLRGRVGEIQKMAEKIVSLKGVKLGKVNFVETQH
ncbi:MAG: nickel-responsive transcriptional regulator NikR [Planctomycetota bacterium]